ncbi:MAG: cytochrome P450, partial [Haloarculaceae archaeon]
MRQQLPRPPDSGVLNAARFGSDPRRFLEGVQSRFEDLVAVPIPGRGPLVVVTNPRLVHDALSRPAEFPRIAPGGSAAMIAERGLVQSEGDLWRQQRSLMAPAFAGEQVAAYANTVGERVQELAAEWRADPGERNVHAEMTALTIRVASETLLGDDIGLEGAERFHGWMQTAGNEFEFSPSALAPAFLGSTSPAFEEAADGIRAMGEEIIARRRESLAEGGSEAGNGDGNGEAPKDMLAMLIRAEERGVEMPPNQIRDEVLTFLIAGHETTALSLTYAWALLSWHPEVREQVRKEAREVLGDATPRYEHVRELDYTQRAFREAIRLYPAAWAVFRSTDEEVRLGDYAIPPGASVILPQWSIHRDPRYFEAPDEFDPDRWTRRRPGNVEAYFPFSSGPHSCIGQGFALSGATLVLAGLAREFDVAIAEDALSDLRATATLRPADAVPGRIERA